MRKETEITIDEGRDAGKKFKIIEMPAFQADRWATRALLLMGKSTKGGIAALGTMSIQTILEGLSDVDFEKTEPLLQELLECASYQKNGSSVVMKKEFVDDVVEEWTTLFKLRFEALKLVLGFLEKGDGLGTK